MSAAPYGLLRSIRSPDDLRDLTEDQLKELSLEIRAFLIEHVCQTGGHLGPNLGVIELTLAVHRVFESPRDPIIFDTGHQSYVHKILTGRQDQFPTLRQRHGLSGYPSPTESEHDWVANSHASTALSYADGLAKAIRLQRQSGTVVAFVGDGSLTGGMAWEALNNIAASDDLPLVIVVNDNGRSYTPTVGGLARYLAGLRTNPRYEQILDLVKRNVSRAPLVGNVAYDILHGIKIGLKDVLAPQGMFSDLGLKYVGPIDGHDVGAVERAFQQAKQFRGPVLVHCVTRKGNGFKAAENHEEDRLHAVGKINATTGEVARRSVRTDVDRRVLRGAARARQYERPRRRHYGSHGVSDGPAQICPGVSRPLFRRRHRRAACGDFSGGSGDGWVASSGRGVFDLPQSRL